MNKLILVLIACLTIFSCDDDGDQQTLDVQRFTIEIPSAWTLEELQGYDSYVWQIRINEEETISIDLGWYSAPLDVDNVTHDITSKTIDGKNAKIVTPKNFQRGTTGVYFDNLDNQGTKFQMSGIDLSEMNQRRLLKAIETLKFP